jgi:hypothetical protein
MTKSIGYYLSGPVPPELEELEKNAHKLDPVGRSLLSDFVNGCGAYQVYCDRQYSKNADKRLAEMRDSEGNIFLFEYIKADPLLEPLLTLEMSALHWVELRGWVNQFVLESLRTSAAPLNSHLIPQVVKAVDTRDLCRALNSLNECDENYSDLKASYWDGSLSIEIQGKTYSPKQESEYPHDWVFPVVMLQDLDETLRRESVREALEKAYAMIRG